MTVLISAAPLMIWWVDDKVFFFFLQKLPHAFDPLLSLMVVELIFWTQILPDFIFQMRVADGDFDMAANQKLARIGEPLGGQRQAVCGHMQSFGLFKTFVCSAGDVMTAQTAVDGIENVSMHRKTNLVDNNER